MPADLFLCGNPHCEWTQRAEDELKRLQVPHTRLDAQLHRDICPVELVPSYPTLIAMEPGGSPEPVGVRLAGTMAAPEERLLCADGVCQLQDRK